jgi:multiple sugar transport system substrate-binding protein
LLAILAVLALLAACTGGPERQAAEDRAAGEGSEPVTVGGSEGDGAAVTLTFSDWHLAEDVWAASLEEAFADFAEQHPDIAVELDVVSYADKETRYATEIDGGQGPDVFHLHGSILPFADRGYLMDLTELIESEDSGFIDQWYPAVMEQLLVDGSYYALPGDFMAMTMMYNSAMLEEAGLDAGNLPQTWDEWMRYADALNNPDAGQWAFGTIGAIDPGFELRVAPVFYSHGASYLNEDHTCSALHTPEAREAFGFLVGLVQDGYVPPGVTSQNAGTVREQLANEQIAMAFGTGWTAPIVDAINPDLDAFETLVTGPVPVKAGVNPEQPTTAWLSWWAINPNTAHPEEAWELVKFLTSQETEQKFFDDNRVLSSRSDVSGARDGGGPEGYQPLVEDKFASVIAEQIPEAQFPPKIPELAQVLETINVAAQRAFVGEVTADEALAEAHDEINRLLGGSDCPTF